MSTVVAQPACTPTQRGDAAILIEIVERAMHPSASEWLFLRELRVGTGRQNGRAHCLDAFALNTLPHKAMKRVCYEVKTSHRDFLSERLLCNHEAVQRGWSQRPNRANRVLANLSRAMSKVDHPALRKHWTGRWNYPMLTTGRSRIDERLEENTAMIPDQLIALLCQQVS